MNDQTAKAKKRYMKKEEYIGKKFGLLTVIEFDHYDNKSQAYMKCKCECGNMTIAPIAGLKSGNNKSCGCLHAQVKREIVKHRKDQTTHGESRTRLYRIWRGMRNRCETDTKWNKNYGNRGISICKEWKNYEVFRDWALSHGYAEDLSIDRIDVNGNYEPSNCRWADMKSQGRNRRNTFYVEYCGVKMPLKEACERTGMAYSTAWKRIKRYGMGVEDALHTKPIHGKRLCHVK